MLPSAKMLTLGLVGLTVTVVMGFLIAVLLISWFSNPPFGLGNAPPQPVAFPHTVHAGPTVEGGMGIQCEFCHRNVTRGAAATVPAVEQCLFCHKTIEGQKPSAQAEIATVRQSFEDNDPSTGSGCTGCRPTLGSSTRPTSGSLPTQTNRHDRNRW